MCPHPTELLNEHQTKKPKRLQRPLTPDTQTLDLLRARLEELTMSHSGMKRINRAFKAGNLAEVGFSHEDIADLERRVATYKGWWGPRPCPGYLIKRVGAQIRRLRRRIAAMEQRAQQTAGCKGADRGEIVQDAPFKPVGLYLPAPRAGGVRLWCTGVAAARQTGLYELAAAG